MSQDINNDGEPTITIKSKQLTVPVSPGPAPAPGYQQPISGGLAPQGQPVAPQAHPEDSFLVRNRWFVLAGAVALAAVVVIAALLLLADHSKKDSAAILVKAAPLVNSLSATLARAQSPHSFDAAGDRAAKLMTDFDLFRARAQEIGDESVRSSTLSLLNAESEYLDAISDMRNIVNVPGSKFDNASDDIDRASGSIQSASRAMGQFELPAEPAPFPQNFELRRANTHLSTLSGSHVG